MAGSGDNAGVHPRCRPSADARDQGVRRRRLCADGRTAAADPGDRPPLRRQPRAARRDRPDADRGGVPRRRDASGGGARRPNAPSRGPTARCRSFSCGGRRNLRLSCLARNITASDFLRNAKKIWFDQLRPWRFCAVGFARRKRGADPVGETHSGRRKNGREERHVSRHRSRHVERQGAADRRRARRRSPRPPPRSSCRARIPAGPSRIRPTGSPPPRPRSPN